MTAATLVAGTSTDVARLACAMPAAPNRLSHTAKAMNVLCRIAPWKMEPEAALEERQRRAMANVRRPEVSIAPSKIIA